MNIAGRLDKLERATAGRSTDPGRVIRLIVREGGETQDEAIARWCAENPDESPPSDDDFIILHSIVSPNREAP